MSPKVVKVKALENSQLRLFFDNGETRIFDVSPYIDKGFFKELRNSHYFKQVKLSLVVFSGPTNKILAQKPYF